MAKRKQKTIQVRTKQNWATLLVRLGVGVMFLVFGALKLISLLQDGAQADIVGLLTSIGFVPALYWALLLALTETVGGLLVLLGLFTRKAALPLTIVLVVAIATVTWKNTPQLLKDLGLLGATLSLVFSDSGPLSLDNKLK